MSRVSARQSFQEPPLVDFYPEFEHCAICGEKLNILKTRQKKLVTLEIGALQVKEYILVCPRDHEVYASEELRRLSPAGCKFGFDVLVYVGKAIFSRNCNVKEIIVELIEKNICMSERQIGYLGRKFIIYLALAHRQSCDYLNMAIKRRGGYILHIDGTCEGDSPMLFTGIDELSGVVLENIKIPSEQADAIIPFLAEIRERYGVPLGLVHDMGRGILAAVATVFPGVADFICHFHFLRDIGKDMMDKDYQKVRKGLKKHGIRASLRRKKKAMGKISGSDLKSLGVLMDGHTPINLPAGGVPSAASHALIHWILDYPAELEGYGFPFDRPHLALYQRIQTAFELLEKMVPPPKKRNALNSLYGLLSEVFVDKELKEAAQSLEDKAGVFDALRQALSIALPKGAEGLNDDGTEQDIKTIEQKVKEFRKWADEKGLAVDNCYEKMIKQIDKYWNKLFADPIRVSTDDGPKLIQPQRTNNILERFFRDFKRGHRQREGTASLTKMLRSILAETPLVKNLDNEEYVKILLDGCQTLEERFAKIDSKLAQKSLRESQQNAERISPELKKMIRHPDFQNKISKLIATYAN